MRAPGSAASSRRVNQFLRGHQAAPGGARSLADELTVAPGYELAVAAALDGRLGAALLDDRTAAGELLDKAGRDGGRVLISRDVADRGVSAAVAARPRIRTACASTSPVTVRPPR